MDNYVVDEIKKVTNQLVYQWYYPKKSKMKRKDFEENLLGAQYSSCIAFCEYLSYIYEKEKITLDELIGEIHKLKMDLWNKHQRITPGLKPCKNVEDSMDLEPDMNKLVSSGRIMSRIHKQDAAQKQTNRQMTNAYLAEGLKDDEKNNR